MATLQKNRFVSVIQKMMGFSAASQTSTSQIDEYDADPVSLSVLLGNGVDVIKTRQQIMRDWQMMTHDAVVSTALRLHVTAALGGHESRGDLVFIETPAEFKGNAKVEKAVAELQKELGPLFNRIAGPSAFNACAFGDSYGRIYGQKGIGLLDILTDEMVYPPLVQPFERGSQTVAYLVATGERNNERLNVAQMIRMKMPRSAYIPQQRVIQKAMKIALLEDSMENLPAVPSLAGGSFLSGCETAYSRMSAALAGMVGANIANALDERWFAVNYSGMTVEQRQTFKTSFTRLLMQSKTLTEKMVNEGKYSTSKFFGVLPVWAEKQVTELNTAGGAAGKSQAVGATPDEVIMHARFLSGALGIDLSMLGFADQLSGGLGDGGFFRMSAHAAERSRLIRVALSDFFDQAVRLHLLFKNGGNFDVTNKFWNINYFGSISALQAENQRTKQDAMNTGAVLVQTLSGLRELGLDKKAVVAILVSEMGMDEDQAKLISESLKPPPDPMGGDMGGGFGGPPGADGGGGPAVPFPADDGGEGGA